MAKQRRTAAPAAKGKSKAARKPAGVRAKSRTTAARSARAGKAPAVKRTSTPAPPTPPPPAPAPPPRKPGFYEAVAIYERGVQALQRHDYQGAAGHFRSVLDRYPEERELLERARLYLRVCERETARQPPAPRTPSERVYAATVALNSGDQSTALEHLQRALSEDPEHDHAHYTMAVALGSRGQVDEALEYLKNAIGLNPENRALARQDPDLEPIRPHARFAAALDTPAFKRRSARSRR
jgi:tetratricopeptide (TPR) repeat protein